MFSDPLSLSRPATHTVFGGVAINEVPSPLLVRPQL